MLSMDSVMIPLQLSFDLPRSFHLRIIELVTSAYWTVDVGTSFFCGFYLPEGTLVVNVLSTSRHYLRTWFCLDILIVIVDWVIVASSQPNGLQLAGMARVGKTLRFLR